MNLSNLLVENKHLFENRLINDYNFDKKSARNFSNKIFNEFILSLIDNPNLCYALHISNRDRLS